MARGAERKAPKRCFLRATFFNDQSRVQWSSVVNWLKTAFVPRSPRRIPETVVYDSVVMPQDMDRQTNE